MILLSGSKAFAYFSVIVKNYLIQRIKAYKKKVLTDISFDKDVLEKTNDNIIEPPYEVDIQKREFLELLKDEIANWRSKFKKEQESTVLEAVIMLLNNPDLVEILSKKRNLFISKRNNWTINQASC